VRAVAVGLLLMPQPQSIDFAIAGDAAGDIPSDAQNLESKTSSCFNNCYQ
jgi:hypothetical protein